MKNEQLMVAAFHAKAGATIQHHPTIASPEDATLRMNLINEEASELECALEDGDICAIADAIGDLLYVTLGTAVSCGIDIEAVFHEIHRSNMSKFIDGQRRTDGKWIKGPSYSRPDILGLLGRQQPECLV